MPCTGKVWSKENSHRNAGEKVSYITTLENAISAEVHFSADPISKQFYHWVGINPIKKRLGADCGSNSNKLKKAGKTTKPFRYDLNQIPYDYIVEVT